MSTTEAKEILGQPRVGLGTEASSLSELRKFVSQTGQKFYGRAQTSDQQIFELVVDHNEYNLPPKFRADDIVIDIGAHIGGFSFAALVRGAGKVYAYEAHPDNHAIASQNLARFGSKIDCEQQAVWRSDQPSQTLYNETLVGSTNTGGVSLLWNEAGNAVQTISLDEILEKASEGFTKPIRLLKLDCEGSEYPILFTSNRLEIVEEVCGEYHEMPPERIPERAKVPGKFLNFDRFALKDFFEERGWSIVLEPKGDRLGLFHARSTSKTMASAETFSVTEFMAEVRKAVRSREAAGDTSFINASRELFRLLNEEGFFAEPITDFDSHAASWIGPGELPALRLQPEFQPKPDDHYHVNDLLQYHDREFIWNAYKAILKREPDETGLRSFLTRLRNGSRNKIDILSSLHSSAEGKRANVSIEGLALPAFIRKIYRVPVVGYLAETAVAIGRLPKMIRSQRQFETHFVAQQDRLAAHITHTNHLLLNKIERVAADSRSETDSLRTGLIALQQSSRTSLLNLAKLQKQLAVLQHQQVSALFRDQAPLREAQVAARTGASNHSADANELEAVEASLSEYLRGDSEAVKKDLEFYSSLLKEAGITREILDLGSGRGAWLEVLKDSGFQARGIESNPKLVEIGSQRGLEIRQGDVIEHLQEQADASLQAVTAFHLIEHFEFQKQFQLLVEIRRVLKPGGLVMLETPNPKNLVVGACNFYADPTHRQPLFPESLHFLLDRLGFVRTRIDYLHPSEGSPFNNSAPGSKELDTWLFGPRDFAAIGWKS
jgi:O-antigen chain-terminating methyltransferase